MKDHKPCGVCYSNDPFHWEYGCLRATMIVKVLINGDKATTETMKKHSDHIAVCEKYKATRGVNSCRNGRGGGGGGDRSTTKVQQTTSPKRPPPCDNLQPPPALRTPPPFSPPHRHSNFPNIQNLSSDSDDNDSFEIEYGNNVDLAGNISPKPSANSTIFSSPTLYHLPFGGLPNLTA